MIKPSEEFLQIYLHVLYSYSSGYIAFRSFNEKGARYKNKSYNIWLPSDDELNNKAMEFVRKVNRDGLACYTIPGTVAKIGEAKAEHILQMQTMLVDIDQGDIAGKLTKLEREFLAPTLIVESGGITKDKQKKLHLYWQLTKAVTGDELQQLLDVRYRLALFIEGDLHFKSAHQPIRVVGSIYHKENQHKLVTIRSYNRIEYDFSEIIAKVSNLPRILIDNKTSLQKLLINKTYSGGSGQNTRFNVISRVIGYWIRKYHQGLIDEKQLWQEISDYNMVNIVPSWPEDKLRQAVSGLWKKHIKQYGVAKITKQYQSFSLNKLITDEARVPEDIIAPRLLTPGGLLVFGGAPKVGKSDFLLSMLTHMAAGYEFLGFKPSRPLRVFYLQTEISYHYLRERLQNMQLAAELISKAKDNLYVSCDNNIVLNKEGSEAIIKHIQEALPEKPDIIAIDPLRNIFDGGRNGAGENDNEAMLFFLQQRIELLRQRINPECGIIIVHHTKKITRKQFDLEPFQAFCGASSLRSFYSTGMLLYQMDNNNNYCKITFELRHGRSLANKIVQKQLNGWQEIIDKNKNVTNNNVKDIIIELLEQEALQGKFYLMKQFAERFQYHLKLGNSRNIYNECSKAASNGDLKFFDNPKEYGVNLKNAGFGFLCSENMKIAMIRSGAGSKYQAILPTHYKCKYSGRKKKMRNINIWQINYEEVV
ncbi:MAG: AAA family ATPase [Rickettsiaceae bacterium]|nr:AAA family ATPase [Rickettsiaceae bacterium]